MTVQEAFLFRELITCGMGMPKKRSTQLTATQSPDPDSDPKGSSSWL